MIRALLGVLAIASLLYGTFGAFLDTERQGEFLWDLDYYRAAAARWRAGEDPYLSGTSPTGYYYSVTVTPLLARLFAGFEAERLYVALMSVGLIATLVLAVRSVRAPADDLRLCWLYAFAFGNAEVIYVLASGNLAWFTALVLATALFAAARGRWVVFYLLVGIASLVKPYSLVLLSVPFALGTLSRTAAIALLPWLGDNLVCWTLWPDLAASRVDAIWLGVLEPLQLRYSLAGRLSRALADQGGLDVATATLSAVIAQLLVALALALCLRWRRPTEPRRAFALAVVAAFAAFPRMAGYDAFVFGPAVLVAFLPSAERRLSGHAMIAASLALFAGLLKEGLAILPLVALAAFPSLTERRSSASAARRV